MEKFCKSCGMPMERPEDFANNNINSDYCYYCSDNGDKEKYYNKKESYEDELKKENYYMKKEKKLSKISKKRIKTESKQLKNQQRKKDSLSLFKF